MVPRRDGLPHVEGYVLKETSHILRRWKMYWFVLKENQVIYRKCCGELNVLYTVLWNLTVKD